MSIFTSTFLVGFRMPTLHLELWLPQQAADWPSSDTLQPGVPFPTCSAARTTWAKKAFGPAHAMLNFRDRGESRWKGLVNWKCGLTVGWTLEEGFWALRPCSFLTLADKPAILSLLGRGKSNAADWTPTWDQQWPGFSTGSGLSSCSSCRRFSLHMQHIPTSPATPFFMVPVWLPCYRCEHRHIILSRALPSLWKRIIIKTVYEEALRSSPELLPEPESLHTDANSVTATEPNCFSIPLSYLTNILHLSHTFCSL